MVLFFAFVTEIGAVATFAELITAGVAVARQNVIVSIVAYFFLIGKYGIRVGDRVQVGWVSDYRDSLDLQRRRMEMSLSSIFAAEFEPSVRIHFTTSAIEVNGRFAVVVDKAGEIDERIVSEIFAASATNQT